MDPITAKYIPLKYDELPNGIHIVQSHQGSGKTKRINDLSGQTALLVGARNELGKQTLARCSDVIHTSHLADDKHTKTSEEIRGETNLFICYPSLYKLGGKWIDFDNLLIDEPVLVWDMSVNFLPKAANNAEFLARLIHTPRVILMGADIPPYILEELKEIAAQRPDDLGTEITHHHYTYPFLEDVEVVFCDEKKEMNTLIREQMKARMDYKKSLTDELWNLDNHINGVVIATEVNEGSKTIKADWLEEFPEAKIVVITSTTASDFDERLTAELSRVGNTEIDMLIYSPTWALGINILKKFDLTVGNFKGNPHKPLTYYEQLQALTRERYPKKIVVLDDYRHPIEKYKNIFSGGLTPYQQLTKLITYNARFRQGKIEYKAEDYFFRNPTTKNMEALNQRELIRTINIFKDKMKSRIMRKQQLCMELEKYGANVIQYPHDKKITQKIEAVKEEEELKILDPKCLIYTDEEMKDPLNDSENRREKTRITKLLGRCKTWKDLAQYDGSKVKDNEYRRYRLDKNTYNSPQTSLLGRAPTLLFELVKQVKELAIKVMEDKMILTNEQFIVSDLYKKLSGSNKNRYNTLLDGRGWKLFESYSHNPNPIEFLEQLLRKWNYYSRLQLNPSYDYSRFNTTKRKGDRRDLKRVAAAEHQTEFRKWKTTNGTLFKTENNIKNLTYKDYLWFGLNAGLFNFDELGTDTQDYIKTFPHLLIEEYETRDYV